MIISSVVPLMPCQDFVISCHFRDSVLSHSMPPDTRLTPFPRVSPRALVNDV